MWCWWSKEFALIKLLAWVISCSWLSCKETVSMLLWCDAPPLMLWFTWFRNTAMSIAHTLLQLVLWSKILFMCYHVIGNKKTWRRDRGSFIWYVNIFRSCALSLFLYLYTFFLLYTFFVFYTKVRFYEVRWDILIF